MKLVGATDSHVGNVREANQDRVYFGGLVAALADGMGGHQGGERAAELAIAEFEHADQKLTESELVGIIMEANRQVHHHAADNGLAGMGTTLVALTLHGDETITVANVGDSRAYWLRGDYMGQVTEDHSFVEDLVRQGRLSPEDAAIHPQRNILTRAVGIGAEVEVDRFPIPEPEVGDRFLLCSDGLFNELSEEEILEILLDAGDPTSTAKALVDAALQTPCRDNVTVAVVDVVEDDDPAVEDQSNRARTTNPITAPVPVVSKSTLQEPGGQSEGSGQASGGTGTMLLDPEDPDPEDPDPEDPEPDNQDPQELDPQELDPKNRAPHELDPEELDPEGQDPEELDPELFLDTTELDPGDLGRTGLAAASPPQQMTVRPRSRVLIFLSAAIVVALIAGGLFLSRSIARSGFHVAEEQGELVVFEGRRDGFLFFDPVRTDIAEPASALSEDQQARIHDGVSSLDEAKALISGILEEQVLASGPAESSEADQAGGNDAGGTGQMTDSSQQDQGSAGDSSSEDEG